MGDSKAATRSAKGNQRAPATEPKDADRTGGRHGAIPDNLKKLSSYKSWVEKIRGTWEEKK